MKLGKEIEWKNNGKYGVMSYGWIGKTHLFTIYWKSFSKGYEGPCITFSTQLPIKLKTDLLYETETEAREAAEKVLEMVLHRLVNKELIKE